MNEKVQAVVVLAGLGLAIITSIILIGYTISINGGYKFTLVGVLFLTVVVYLLSYAQGLMVNSYDNNIDF